MTWMDKQKQIFEDKIAKKGQEETHMGHEDVLVNINKIVQAPGASIPPEKETPTPVEPIVKKREQTTINKNTTVHGDIETQDDVVVYGTLVGDLICEGDLMVYGSIQGTITCHHASLQLAKVEGNMTCSGSLELSQDSMLHGDVKAINLQTSGTIKGQIIVEETAQFLSSATTIGDITAFEIQVDKGSVIQGRLSITETR